MQRVALGIKKGRCLLAAAFRLVVYAIGMDARGAGSRLILVYVVECHGPQLPWLV